MDLKLKIDINAINALSPLKKNLLLVLPPLIIAGLFVYFLILPDMDEMGKLKASIEKQKADIELFQKQSASLATLKTEYLVQKNRLDELQKQLPEEREVSGLLKQVSELAIRTGLRIISWRPREKSIHPSNEVYEIPVDIEMRGSYHMFGKFFSSITKLDRIVNISNINMKLGQYIKGETETVLNVSFIGLTYSMIPEKERKEIAAKSKKKK